MLTGIRVLIVDDNQMMRGFLEILLKKKPNIGKIEQAKNGQEALQKIETFRPDVILMDVEMPVMDGLTTLQNIKSNKFMKKYSFPFEVIILSGTMYENNANVRKAKFLGAYDVMAKPDGKSMSMSVDGNKLYEAIVKASKKG